MASQPKANRRGRPRKAPYRDPDGAPNLSPNQRKAIETELALWAEKPRGVDKWPAPRTGGVVARSVGVTRAAVDKWRNDPLYVQSFRGALISRILGPNAPATLAWKRADNDAKETRNRVAEAQTGLRGIGSDGEEKFRLLCELIEPTFPKGGLPNYIDRPIGEPPPPRWFHSVSEYVSAVIRSGGLLRDPKSEK